MNGPTPRAICIIDDDDAVRDSLGELLRTYKFSVRGFSSALEFLDDRGAQTDDYACVIVDLHMPGMNGLELLELLQSIRAPFPFVMITGRGDSTLKERARRAGVVAMLDKPVGEEILIDVIDRAIASRSATAA